MYHHKIEFIPLLTAAWPLGLLSGCPLDVVWPSISCYVGGCTSGFVSELVPHSGMGFLNTLRTVFQIRSSLQLMGSDSSICNKHILIRVLSQGSTLRIYFSDAVKNLK